MCELNRDIRAYLQRLQTHLDKAKAARPGT
jgi:hypothetical protein